MAEAAAIKAEERRERLLRAAERCFIDSGFHGARMAQIAKEAQMSPGHIYHYFDSKEQIIAEMVHAHAEEKLSGLEVFEQAGDRVVDLMVEKLEESVDPDADPFWSALMLEMSAEATRNPEIAKTLRDMDADMKARVINCLGDNVNRDKIDARLEVFVAILQGIGIRNILNPDIDTPAVLGLVRGIVETLFRKPHQQQA